MAKTPELTEIPQLTNRLVTETPQAATTPEDCSAGAVTDAERAALDLWAGLVRVTDGVRASLAAELAPEHGLAPEEVELLMRLTEAPEERLRMIDISRSLTLSASGTTRLIDRLGRRGLVQRAACPSDRRVVYAGLTDAGREALENAAPALRAGLVEHLMRHLKPRELELLSCSLEKILAAEERGTR